MVKISYVSSNPYHPSGVAGKLLKGFPVRSCSSLNNYLPLDLFEFCRTDPGDFHHLFNAFKTPM